MENQITVTSIQNVVYICKNNPANKVDFYTNKHGLRGHELIFRICGEVETDFDGTILKNKRGTVQYLPKGQGSQMYMVKTIETGECIDIHFDSDIPLSDTAFCTEENLTSDISEAFEKIYKLWKKKDLGYYYDSMRLLYKILKEITQSTQCDVLYDRIKDGISYLNKHFCDESINYEEAASRCHISYSYFRRLFVKHFDVSPAKYVYNKKIDYAKELLSTNNFNVNEVANMVGFKDIYYFSAAFKRSTGKSPKNFAKSL